MINTKSFFKDIFSSLFLILWALLMICAVAFTRTSANEKISSDYKIMEEASTLSFRAMQEIKSEKERRGIELSPKDTLQTGMIGDYVTSITTTTGVIAAKRTSTNPNWAAVIVKMFRRANLKAGDQVAMVFSGSFPALNISAMAAAQVYGVKTCIMASIGASCYGANNEDFTFFDMSEHLYSAGILNSRLSYVSLGGDADIGNEFDITVKNEIISRIEASGIPFINEPDFGKNIELRLSYLRENVPAVKFMLNVGGSMVGLGSGGNAFIDTGFIEPKYSYTSSFWENKDKNCGLLQFFLSRGVPVASLLNIKGLAVEYGIPYDPQIAPQIGVGEAYYDTQYSPTVPIIALILSVAALIIIFFYRKRGMNEVNAYERNYILR